MIASMRRWAEAAVDEFEADFVPDGGDPSGEPGLEVDGLAALRLCAEVLEEKEFVAMSVRIGLLLCDLGEDENVLENHGEVA